jgi:hypothetical protein
MIPYQICGKLVRPFGVEVIITLGTSIPNILPIFIFLEYLLEKLGLTIDISTSLTKTPGLLNTPI